MSILHLLLTGGSYGASGLAIAAGTTAAAVLLVGIGLLIHGRASRLSLHFFAITAAAAGWLACFSLLYAARDPLVALTWARAGHFFVCLLPAAVWHFAAAVVGGRRLRSSVVAAWIFCGAVGVLGSVTPLFIPGVRGFSWGFYPRARLYDVAYMVIFGAIIVAAMRELRRSFRGSEGRGRERAGLLLVAVALGSLSFIDAFPSFGIDMEPVGYMSILAFAGVAAIAMWRYQVIEVTPEFAAGQILETMKGAVLVADMEGKIRVANRAAAAMLGYHPADLIGLHIRTILQPEDNMTTGQLLASMGVLEQTMIWRTAEGTRVDVLAASSFVRRADGEPVAVVYIATDYTDRKRAEAALRESEHRYRFLFETNPLPMWVYDYETLRFVAVNEAAVRHYGYTREEFLKRTIRDIRPEEDIPLMYEALSGLQEKQGPRMFRHRRKDGSVVDVDISSFEFVSGGRRTRLVIAQDVTDRLRAETLLRESEERYRNVVELMPDAVFVHMDGRVTFVNKAAVKLLGASGPQDLVGHNLLDFVHPDYRSTVQSRLSVLSRGREVPLIEEKLVRLDGTPVDVEVAAIGFTYEGRAAVQVVARDISERKAIEESLRETELRYRDLFEYANDIVYTHDLEGRITSMNLAGQRVGGFTLDELLTMNITDLVSPEDQERGMNALRQKLDGQAQTTSYEVDVMAKDGRRISMEVNTRLMFRDGKPVGVQGIARDITERKSNEARFRLLFERNLAGVFRGTVDGRIVECNEALARIFGFDSKDELMSEPAGSRYMEPEDRQRLIQQLRNQHSLSNVELRMRRRDGTPIWVLENVSLLEGGQVLEGTIIDITDRKTAQEQMEYQAYHDSLTGLPNRLLFRDRLAVALARARRNGRGAAVMFLDLDQFKLVNDTLGHTVGDALLTAAASRLVNCVRAEDTVSRMGGDEFTILLSDVGDHRAAATVAQKVLDSIALPVTVEHHELFVTTSIGIAMFPEDGNDVETLLKNADRAMYRAKEMGRNNYQYATPATFDASVGRLSLESSLHHAFERQEFIVHYQPMVDIASHRIVGAEALIRWNHPQNGLMMPEDFIPIAEECQLIVPLGEWVLMTACRQMKDWHEAGHKRLRVAVNLSPRQFQQRDLASLVERVLSETGFPPGCLDLEITESTAMQNAELSLAVMRRLKEMGVRISIDDFGTGYSSLNYLKRFPIDTVKIDQEFVRDLSNDPSDGAIISAVISMARALNLRVIAEGVETEEQLAFLRREQCGEMQGFLYSRPVPAEEFEVALRLRARV